MTHEKVSGLDSRAVHMVYSIVLENARKSVHQAMFF